MSTQDKNNLDAFLLEEKTSICPTHGDYESRGRNILGTWVGTRCPDCVVLHEKSERSRREKTQQGRLGQLAKEMQDRAGIPLRFRNRSFANFSPPDEKTGTTKRILEKYAKDFCSHMSRGTSFILCGGPGTGKTHLAAATGNAIITLHIRSVKYLTNLSFLRQIKATWATSSARSEQDVIDDLVEYDLLILDDIGTQYGTMLEKLILLDVINLRYESIKPTIVIMNCPMQEALTYLGDCVIDRLMEGGGLILPFTGSSYRSNVHLNCALEHSN